MSLGFLVDPATKQIKGENHDQTEIRHRIALLCICAPSAFAAKSASAAAGRAQECVRSGSTFFGPHCLGKADAGNPTAQYSHSDIKNRTAIAIGGTNANSSSETTASSPTTLAGTLSGVKTALVCASVSLTGSLTNAATGVSGTGVITHTGCTIEEPKEKGCEVTGGTIKTSTLTVTTVGQTENNKIKFESPEGGKGAFATVNLKGCANEAPPAGAYPVTGSLIATTNGATIELVEATITGQKTLKFGGQVAGLNGAITISKSGGNPLVLT